MTSMRYLLVIILAAFLAACASMGRPEGGPRDTDPPVYVGSNPRPGQLRFSGNKIVVEFNENVALDDAMNKVVVSPAQRTTPVVSAIGRKVTVELRDTMQPDMTYTIDFADAIKDLNESNILDGFALDFATGDSIDTLRISGRVFEARNLEPAQGMLIGVYSNLSDTAITTLPFERITKTNQLGQFTLRNLKAGTYRIFAINDVNRDYHWDRSEDVAFYDVTISPSSEPITVIDTLRTADDRDSIVSRPGTRFLPDDVLLTWFNENYSPQYLRDYERPDNRRITFNFGAPADTLPIIKLLDTHRAGDEISTWSTLESSSTLDSLVYWIIDTSLMALDTLRVEAMYYRTDTLENLSLTTDTLRLVVKGAKQKRRDEEKKRKEREEKRRKAIEKGEDPDSVCPPEPAPVLDFKATSGSTQELNRPLSFAATTPVVWFDSAAVKMEMLLDTIWTVVPTPHIARPDSMRSMEFVAPYTWEEGTKYRLTIDSAAIRDAYGVVNKQFTHEFTTKKAEDYSSLIFSISGLQGRPAVVELLNQSDKVVATSPVKGSTAVIDYLAPSTYYARLFIDSDTNGIYTTGNLLDSLQPEEVYYYPKKLTLKKNWDVEQSWDIYELPIDMQKPREITKNKPKKKRGEQEESTNDEEEEDDFFDDPFMNAATRNGGFSTGTDNGLNRRR